MKVFMGRIIRDTAAAALVAAGLFAGGVEARAQFIVKDPFALAQSILQYTQDQMREGGVNLFDAADGISKLEGMRMEFKALEERLAQVTAIARQFGAAYENIQEIAFVSRSVYRDYMTLKEVQYLMSEMSAYGTINTVGNLIRSYSSVSQTLLKEVREGILDISKINQTDPLVMLQSIHDKIGYLYDGYLVIRNYYFNAVREAYIDDLNYQARMRDRLFFNSFYY